jgi:UDP-N-acetylmuramoyl-tripeptide--D-alanyl-D-alanine ligase
MTDAPPLWTAREAAAATDGIATGGWRADGVSIDSRSVAEGDLFIALKGPNFDGHAYAAAALEAGAAAAMIDHLPEGLSSTAPLLRVADTMAGLEALGRIGRHRARARICAVTGSVGKTGTKEALATALAPQGETAASAGSLNNHWGVPLSLARMRPSARFGVFELGMNHAGEITPLTQMVRPHVAIITTIEPAHLGHFDSLDQVADAKAEIFVGVEDGGCAVLNRDNAFFDHLAAAARAQGIERIIGIGADDSAEARLIEMTAEPDGSRVTARIDGHEIVYRVAQPGRHHVINSLAVLAAANALGADMAEAANALGAVAPLAGRGRLHEFAVPGGTVTLIDESYNASPASMRAAIETLGALKPAGHGRRIAVLGDMRELGTGSRDFHAGLAHPLTECGIDLVFCAGTEMKALFDAVGAPVEATHAPDSAALAPMVAAAVKPGDIVTVKGSLASGMKRVVDALLALGNAPSQAVNG